jgi:hypothetical protein
MRPGLYLGGKMTHEDVCALCSLPRRSHCEWDEPGVDHDTTCTKMHHAFRTVQSRGGDLFEEVEG